MKQHSLEAFLHACGGSGPICLDVASADGRSPQRQLLQQPFALVGRHRQADIRLEESSVSRQHALLQVIAGRLFCIDLSSRTGTQWDGGSPGHGWVSGESPIEVGPYRLSLPPSGPNHSVSVADGWDPWARGSLGQQDSPACSLHIADNGSTVCRWRMNRVLAIVGSSSHCKVRLRGPGVARCHCALICTPAGVWMIDLQRCGGVPVNNVAVGHALLEDGDVLQVGSYAIRVAYDSSRASASTPTGDDAGASLTASPAGGNNGHEILPQTVILSPAAEVPRAPSLPATGSIASTESETASVVSSLLRHFSQMQQQMFDQSLTMMFQMFRAMHREQTDILRDELARLDELNHELRVLMAEKIRSEPPPAAPSPAAPPPAAPPPAAPSPAAPPPAAPAAPLSPAHPKPNAKAVSRRGAPQPFASTPATDTPRGNESYPAAGPATPAAAVASPAPAPPSPSPSEDVHLLLCKRMEALQQERQGLWDRIVGVLGKPR